MEEYGWVLPISGREGGVNLKLVKYPYGISGICHAVNGHISGGTAAQLLRTALVVHNTVL